MRTRDRGRSGSRFCRGAGRRQSHPMPPSRGLLHPLRSDCVCVCVSVCVRVCVRAVCAVRARAKGPPAQAGRRQARARDAAAAPNKIKTFREVLRTSRAQTVRVWGGSHLSFLQNERFVFKMSSVAE